jgi:hypothetical protein
MGEHELRNKEYETLTAILKECGEPVNPAEIADPNLPTICSRGSQQADTAASEASGTAAMPPENPARSYSAVICCGDDIILDPMSADLVRAGKVIIADDPDAAESPEDAAACLEAMLERAVNDEVTVDVLALAEEGNGHGAPQVLPQTLARQVVEGNIVYFVLGVVPDAAVMLVSRGGIVGDKAVDDPQDLLISRIGEEKATVLLGVDAFPKILDLFQLVVVMGLGDQGTDGSRADTTNVLSSEVFFNSAQATDLVGSLAGCTGENNTNIGHIRRVNSFLLSFP